MIEEEIMPATILAAAAAFVCTPIAVWDGDGPIWGQDIERAQIYALMTAIRDAGRVYSFAGLETSGRIDLGGCAAGA